MPVLSEYYGDENPNIEDSQLFDIAEGDDGEYLPEQMQDGNKLLNTHHFNITANYKSSHLI